MNGILDEMTIEDIRSLRPSLAVLPIGSTEPHGPHLPYCTDHIVARFIAEEAVRRASAKGAPVVCLPTLPIGNNVNFRAFPFALRIGVDTLMNVVRDVVRQLSDDGVSRVVILNGHGGNTDALRAVLRDIASDDSMPFVCMVHGTQFAEGLKSELVLHPSDHGGECETSCVMALRPDLVRSSRLRDNPFGTVAVDALNEVFFVRPWHLYVPESAGGRTDKASPDKGRRILEAAADGLAAFLVELASAGPSETFPYLPQ
ncbi:MAG: creatininase family protein [Planctomycetes bacterium]|nr:creatininase family protein [Planctomycetota bacterium]